MTDIPQWAIERANYLMMADPLARYKEAFARYIAEHEEPPVDPLLGEAEAVARKVTQNRPDWNTVDIALAGLRRGMELAK